MKPSPPQQQWLPPLLVSLIYKWPRLIIVLFIDLVCDCLQRSFSSPSLGHQQNINLFEPRLHNCLGLPCLVWIYCTAADTVGYTVNHRCILGWFWAFLKFLTSSMAQVILPGLIRGPGLPVPVALTIYCSLPLMHNHLEDLPAASEALLRALPLSAPIAPSRQTKSFTELSRASQYLSHLKFKQWAQAVQSESLSETRSVTWNNVKADVTHFEQSSSEWYFLCEFWI